MTQATNASIPLTGVPTPSTARASVVGRRADVVVTLQGQFADGMVMNAPTETVATYLQRHREWFTTCATPLQVTPLGPDSYAMTLGRFGALGYELEPCFGLELVNDGQQQYWIRTVPVPGQTSATYDVDFNARMVLQPMVAEASPLTTQVEWQLSLQVQLQLPRFLQAVPRSLVQQSGDHLLQQIVRQISRRLTRRVQQDFHTGLGLPLPTQQSFLH